MLCKTRLGWIGIGAAAAMLALTGAASAVTSLTLNPEGKQQVGPQSASNPCVIGGTQCQQPDTMGFNNYTQSGSIHSYDVFSTDLQSPKNEAPPAAIIPYTVAQLEAALGTSLFNVAIDVNTTGAAGETLRLFEVIINGTTEFIYDPGVPGTSDGTVIGGIANNGNGYADWTLQTVDLSGFADGAQVLFHAIWDNATDGAESFFLVGVPGPLAGAGLPGLVMACGGLIALARRRRLQQAV